MSGGFEDPVVTALGKLIKQEIQSPNFIHNVSGWTINKDGSAEFNNLTIRGTFFGTDYIINSNGIFFYSGVPATGNLIISIAGTAGVDAFTNVYPEGLSFTLAGKSIVIGLTGGSPLIYFVSGLSTIFNGAAFQDIILGAGTGQYEFLQWLGAQDNTHNDLMLASLSSSSADGTAVPTHTVQYKDGAGVFHVLWQLISTAANLNIPATVQELIQSFTSDATPLISQTNNTQSNNGFISQFHATVSSIVIKARVTGDTSSRIIVSADGTIQWGPGNTGTDSTLKRIAANFLATPGNFLVGSTTALGDNGVGEIQIANATTPPTTNPVGGAVLHVKQGVPSVRDTGGNELGMVRSYSADSNANLASFTTETDVPGATINVVVTGSNATVIIWTQFDMMIGTTAGTTMVGLLSWNGVDRSEQTVFIAPTVGARNCLGRSYRITGVTAGTYVAKLRATCTASAANNLVEATHSGLTVMVVDQ